MRENGSEDIMLFDVETLKEMSAEEMERLRREMKSLNRLLREELDRRERYCAYCGDRLGTTVFGFRYCCAWHRYLDRHKNEETISRVEFERKRAAHRIRAIKKTVGTAATSSDKAGLARSSASDAFLRKLKIRRIIHEYQTITGESLNKSIRD